MSAALWKRAAKRYRGQAEYANHEGRVLGRHAQEAIDRERATVALLTRVIGALIAQSPADHLVTKRSLLARVPPDGVVFVRETGEDDDVKITYWPESALP